MGLVACSSGEKDPDFDLPMVTITTVCSSDDSICNLIKADSMCKKPREQVVIGDYQFNKRPTGKNAYVQLTRLEKFIKCAERASLIEYVPAEQRFRKPKSEMTPKEIEGKKKYNESIKRRKQDKDNNVLSAMKLKANIENDYRNNNEPFLLYYRWSRYQDLEAHNKLIKLYESKEELNYFLTYQIGRDFSEFDRKLAIDILLDVLEVYPAVKYTSKTISATNEGKEPSLDDNGRVHYDIFRDLSTLYLQENNLYHAYVFAKLLELNNDRSADIQLILMEMSGRQSRKLDSLDDLADEIDSSLKTGTFDKFIFNRLIGIK
jgi:hypothetical protein